MPGSNRFARNLFGVGLLASLGCSAAKEREHDSCGAKPLMTTGATPAFHAFETTLGAGEAHVLSVDGDSARVDGISARISASELSLHVEYRDDAGRQVTLELCADEAGSGSGTIERCSGSTCERGETSVLPLTLHPAPDRVEDDHDLVGEFQGPDWPTWPAGASFDLAVGDGFAVLARGYDGLRFVSTEFDSSGRSTELSHLAPPEGDFYNDVKLLDGRYALVASRDHGMLTIDARDPAAPELLSADLPLARPNGHNLFVRDRVAYLARSAPSGGIAVVDVSDPGYPLLIDDFELENCNDVHDLYVSTRDGHDVAFVNCLDSGLIVVDLASHAVLARYAEAGSHSVSVANPGGHEVLVFSREGFASDVEIASFDGRSELALLGRAAHASAASIHNIACSDARCYVSAYQEGWFELDVSQPSAPKLGAQSGTWRGPGKRFLEGASGIVRKGQRIFVADTERGLLVYQPSRE